MTDAAAMAPLAIDVVSDVVCPWCFIGHRRLDKALALVSGIDVAVRWRPYQLDPSIPATGVDRAQYMANKFGSAERVAAMHERLREAGAAEGIAFRFDAIARSPNTLDAHRLVRWAGIEGVQDGVVERLFAIYFLEGGDIGDPDVLARAAADAGMDAEVVRRLLATDADRAETAAEAENARQMGVTGVPCFILAGRYAVEGAQPAEVLADAIAEVARELRGG